MIKASSEEAVEAAVVKREVSPAPSPAMCCSGCNRVPVPSAATPPGATSPPATRPKKCLCSLEPSSSPPPSCHSQPHLYIGAPPPSTSWYLARNGLLPVGGQAPTSAAWLEVPACFTECALTSYDALEDPITICELVLEWWDTLVQHVRRITFLAGEVIQLGEHETRLMGAAFGSNLVDGRASHLFILQGGTSTFLQLPEVAGSHLYVLRDVYLPSPPPLFLEGSASPARHYLLGHKPVSPEHPVRSITGSVDGHSTPVPPTTTSPIVEVTTGKAPAGEEDPQDDSTMSEA